MSLVDKLLVYLTWQGERTTERLLLRGVKVDCVTAIVKRLYIEVNPQGEALKGFYGETTTGES